MKKILVPIDFSKCSKDAFLYAKGLANTLGFSIKVVHVHNNNFIPAEPMSFPPLPTRQKAILEKMNEFIKTDSENVSGTDILTTQKVETETISALQTTQQILELTKDDSIAMVVIGTVGENSLVKKIFGSISSAVAQRAHCPVLLIHEGMKYHDFNNVLYAANYESIDEDLLQQIIDFGNLFRSEMHFVHVEEKDNYEIIEDTLFYKLFEKGDPSFSFNIVNIRNRSVLDGLNQYAEENNVDLMVLVNRQRSLKDNLLQLSLTKNMALRTTVPLMVFHLLNE